MEQVPEETTPVKEPLAQESEPAKAPFKPFDVSELGDAYKMLVERSNSSMPDVARRAVPLRETVEGLAAKLDQNNPSHRAIFEILLSDKVIDDCMKGLGAYPLEGIDHYLARLLIPPLKTH